MVNITREIFSSQSVSLSKIHRNLLLEVATGVGKTKASLDIINESEGNWLIVVAEKAHLDNWKKDINKHNYNSLLPRITFVLYASLHKYKNKCYYGIILDEAHRCTTLLRRTALGSIKYTKSVLLTATITKNEKFLIESTIGYIHTYKISLNTAIESNILPVPEIHLHPLIMDNTTLSESFTMIKGIKPARINVNCKYEERFKVLAMYKHVNLTVTCTPKQKYDYLCSMVDYYKLKYMKDREVASYNKWMNTASVRKKYWANMKTNSVKPFIKQLPLENRFICFTSSISQCNELGGKNIVHSKIKDPQKIIDKFNNRNINRLYVVDMLKEGVNLVDADAIIIQLNSKNRSAVQMLGRSLRKQFPVIHIFYYKDTVDETYLKNSLPEFENFVVKS